MTKSITTMFIEQLQALPGLQYLALRRQHVDSVHIDCVLDIVVLVILEIVVARGLLLPHVTLMRRLLLPHVTLVVLGLRDPLRPTTE